MLNACQAVAVQLTWGTQCWSGRTYYTESSAAPGSLGLSGPTRSTSGTDPPCNHHQMAVGA